MSEAQEYKLLLSRFLAGEMSGIEFEGAFLNMFKSETNALPEDVYYVLNKLFIDVDAYCGHPDLREDDDLDDQSLEISVREALNKLI